MLSGSLYILIAVLLKNNTPKLEHCRGVRRNTLYILISLFLLANLLC